MSAVDGVANVSLRGGVEVSEEDLELFGGLARQQSEQFLVLSAAGRQRVDLVHLLYVHDVVAVEAVQQAVELEVQVVDEVQIVTPDSFRIAALFVCTEIDSTGPVF